MAAAPVLASSLGLSAQTHQTSLSHASSQAVLRQTVSPTLHRRGRTAVRRVTAASSGGSAPESEPGPSEPKSDPLGPKTKSGTIFCPECDGNGAVQCRQCEGGGVNLVDHFQGRFKTGAPCWLCRGRKQILCGNCNGAGFLGGFLSDSGES